MLHVVVKPTGGVWVERKTEGTTGDGGWRQLESAGIRYAATTPDAAWHGEVAIPWSTILSSQGDVPTLMRFNFTQHKTATGESATWAGPVDYGRDDALMGLIYLRSPGQREAIDVVRGSP